jgi:hypothetical protein
MERTGSLSYIPAMFFRRKSLSLQSLDERLSVVELALQIRREEAAPPTIGKPLELALASLGRAIRQDQQAQ